MVIYNLARPLAYDPNPANYKPGSWIVSNLVDIVAKGGNFMVIFGPDATGKFHPEAVKRLEYAGDWLKVNGEAIYKSRPWVQWKEGTDVRFTRSKDGKYVYAISLKWPGRALIMKSIRPRQASTITMLGYGKALAWRWDDAQGLVIDLPAELQDEAKRPCKQAYSFKIEGTAVAHSAPRTVMQYFGDRALRMAAALPPLPNTLAEWEKRRATVREDLTRLLGLPAREPMRAKVLATREEGDLVVEDVAYLWGEGAYVSANVVRPKKSTGTLPALVVPPGWLGELEQECYKTFVYHIARHGYLLLFIDDPHVGRRAAPCAGLYATAAAAGTQVMGIQVFDTLRGLDYLRTRADVDPGRIGVAGLCQGSEQTWLAAALEDRFQIAVPVCGTTTYAEWARMPATTGRRSLRSLTLRGRRSAAHRLARDQRLHCPAAGVHRQQLGRQLVAGRRLRQGRFDT